mmetsp:Transcript_70207/g.165194  ORF Transcript_70207/g.165194 Transcript_70207/m.165194 type:complete len:157 (+) Transcript_70207:140-610(+)
MLLTAVSVGVLAWVAFLGTVAGLYVVNAILSNTPEERKQASSATGATVLCLVGVGTSGCVAYTLSKDMTQKEHRTAIELGLILDAFSCLAALVLFRVTKCSEWFDAHPSVQLQHTAYGTTEVWQQDDGLTLFKPMRGPTVSVWSLPKPESLQQSLQ